MGTESYAALFLSEAHEHLDALDSGLVALEKKPKDEKTIDTLMRHAHTLKGIAASMEYGAISNLAHSFEGMVENMKNGLATGGIQLLFGAVDELRSLVDEAGQNGPDGNAHPLVDELGEMEVDDLKNDAKHVEKPETFRAVTEIKVRTQKLDTLVDLVAEMLVNRLRLGDAFQKRDEPEAEQLLQEAMERNGSLVEELQYQVLQLRLTPISQIFQRFPRMVRDLGNKLGKNVDLVMEGGALELDRDVLDAIGEPLVHLLRNAVDHGIEKEGSITLTATRERNRAIVSVHDNGKGIDWDTVKAKNQDPTLKDPKDMLFSGISTAQEVSEVSGRGVGLSVVKTNIEKIGGRVDVDSDQGNGTTFYLSLPISLAIIKALLVHVNYRTYAVPLAMVNRLIRVDKDSIQRQADSEVMVVDGKEVPVLRLSKSFVEMSEEELLREHLSSMKEEQKSTQPSEDSVQKDTPSVPKEAGWQDTREGTGMLVSVDGKQAVLLVDAVLTQQDVVVKPLIDVMRGQGFFSAVTILGDGRPVPIVDVEGVISQVISKVV